MQNKVIDVSISYHKSNSNIHTILLLHRKSQNHLLLGGSTLIRHKTLIQAPTLAFFRLITLLNMHCLQLEQYMGRKSDGSGLLIAHSHQICLKNFQMSGNTVMQWVSNVSEIILSSGHPR